MLLLLAAAAATAAPPLVVVGPIISCGWYVVYIQVYVHTHNLLRIIFYCK